MNRRPHASPQAIRRTAAQLRRRAILATLREWAADIAAFVGLLCGLFGWFFLMAMLDPSIAPAVR